MDDFDPASLMEERSLGQIAWRSRRMPWNSFNVFVTSFVTILTVAYVYTSNRPHTAFADWSRSIASIGVMFASTVLGFLIAGFTIFATLTKPELFRRMAVVSEDKSCLSYLKHNFFAFVIVFIHYLSFTALCLLILVAALANGPVSEVVERLFGTPALAKEIMAKIAFCSLVIWFTYILLILKSFIYNIYHVVMTAIRWDFENNPSKKSQQDDTGTSEYLSTGTALPDR